MDNASFVTNIVFIGEVDHGKSTLLGQIAVATKSIHAQRIVERGDLAHVMDQFEEEQRNEMTLDTAQIQVQREGQRFNLIDAPGHLDLLKNMVSGTSRADAAILVIDATEGAKAQTYRHLAIAGLIGCRALVVAINKLDAVKDPQAIFDNIRKVIESRLAQMDFQLTRVIPISARDGSGITSTAAWPWFSGQALLDIFKELAVNCEHRNSVCLDSLIFPVQDVYGDPNNPQFAGRIIAGSVKVGQTIHAVLAAKSLQVRRILKFPRELQTAKEADSVAIETDPKITLPAGEVFSGTVDSVAIVDDVAGDFIWLDRKPLCRLDQVKLRNTSQVVLAKVTEIDGNELAFGDIKRIHFELSSPIVVGRGKNKSCSLNRLVVERNGCVVSGGVV